MANRAENELEKRMKRLSQQARRKAGAAKPAGADRFLRQYYAQVRSSDLAAADDKNLLVAALSAWKTLRSRKPGETIIRIFNPDSDKDGWTCDHTVIEIVNDDMPFLVDSITTELTRLNLAVFLIIHPVIRVQRGKSGRLKEILKGDDRTSNSIAESVMHIEIDEQSLPHARENIKDRLHEILGDVRNSVNDWQPMRARIADVIAGLDAEPPPIPETEVAEAQAFLRWLDDDNFIFLGYSEYDYADTPKGTKLSIRKGARLGVLQRESVVVFEGVRHGTILSDDVARFTRLPRLLTLSKSNGRSTVHRSNHLDTIGLKKFDATGKVVGEQLFVGLYASKVYQQSVHKIPVLRRKVNCVISKSELAPTGHSGKALFHILETLPRDDLFQFSDDELFETAMGILGLQERPRVAMFVRSDPFGRFASCLIFMPRERYTTQVRGRMQRIVEAGFNGRVTVFYVQVSDSALARLQFIVKTVPGDSTPQRHATIEEMLALAGRDWRDELSQALTTRHGEARGLDLFRVYADAFPVFYREIHDPESAVDDIQKISAVAAGGNVAMELYWPKSAAAHEIGFKVYHPSQLPISDILPILENIGFKVIDEVAHQIKPNDRDSSIWVHDFKMVLRESITVDLSKVKQNFEDLFAAVWRGAMENDGFNRLVIRAGIKPRQIVVLRAYCKYLRQAAIPFSQAYMEETLSNNPTITRLIIDLFETLFDPNDDNARNARATRLQTRILKELDAVENLDEDRILRRYLNMVQATLRTNFYQSANGGGPKDYVSFKLDSMAIDELPLPRPMVEIFVHSARVEGVHLRGGKVARGGIRWSDRREDFRTEILGLMKAQMTKNAVIVPVGAKGGFVVKQPPAEGGREALLKEGIACYRILICGMLDITDNLKPGTLSYPKDVVRRDGDDPYLVVAADKGTAAFSDIANGIAREYDFWLDDAFASGGSVGYDHKKMGITARGAWESVKRHFREMGINTQTTDFTCVGVGDMSGDVFGNGMLLSEHIMLLGAFNHLHIFVDPNPDPAKSFLERRRLFQLSQSSWSDYNSDLISRGGGIFERKAKSIRVTPQMREAFGLSGKDTLTPNDLIRGMLCAPIELMWFGGIGTYVKSTGESQIDVGDRVNDPVRLNARDLRCKVIAEGANLGITQLGRIEYALAGGRISTDFIDNSAGVGSSDHEVNIKILLGEVMAAGDITRSNRNKLLARMTDELAEHVLMDNYRQSMALTHCEFDPTGMLDEAIRFMRELERAGQLDRQVEFLPDDEALEERRAAGIGLTRPEIAVLLAYAKMTLYNHVLDSEVADDPFLAQDAGLYFPKPLRLKFGDFVPGHRLRREISATYITNSLINRAGPTFISEMREQTGASPAEITKAYLITRQVFGMHALWGRIEKLDDIVPAETQTAMNMDILRLIRRGTLWMLRHGRQPLDVSRAIEQYEPGVKELADCLGARISAQLKINIVVSAKAYTRQGVPKDLAREIVGLDAMFSGYDIVRIAAGSSRVAEVARVYFNIGDRFGLDWLRSSAEALKTENQWQVMAVSAIIEDLYAQQMALSTKVVHESGQAAASADAVIEAWASANDRRVTRAENIVDELKASGSVDLAMLSVANREIRSLLAR